MQNMNIDIYKCERIIEQAREFYSHTLNRSEGLYAREFIEHKLGLNEDTVKKYHLGCSPASPYGLTEYLTSHGFSEEEIIEAGLAVRDKNGFCEDRFKDFRVIIPFCDAHGKPLGFGGLSVNTIGSNLKMTPISEVFRRNEIVFGLNETRVARSDVLILTNNIMNVFALTNTSYHNVACPATSSLSQMQACEIKSLYDEVVILVDEDSRHRWDISKAYMALKQAGIKTTVVSFANNGYKEVYVDEFFKNHGRKELDQLIDDVRRYGQKIIRP